MPIGRGVPVTDGKREVRNDITNELWQGGSRAFLCSPG